jgi:hypothetical protein
MLSKGLTKVTKKFVKEKRIAAGRRSDHLSGWQISRFREPTLAEQLKPAAWQIMEQAYLLASDNGQLPANARQIMYAARPLMMTLTKGKCWEKSSYFTQVLLPDYISEHPDKTANWDVVYDARGHFVEPHVLRKLGIGTLEVRSYVNSWSDGNGTTQYMDAARSVLGELDLAIGSNGKAHNTKPGVNKLGDELNITIQTLYPTRGPTNRYRFALFIEKEGFTPLLERAQIDARYDLAIFSSKGMSTTATRMLVEWLSNAGVTILVLHDFDLSGLTICHTLSHDTRRYSFQTEPDVVDIGLRLDDVQHMGLQSEPVLIKQRLDPRWKFKYSDDVYDVSDEELDFLVEKRADYSDAWQGKRVELNAMTSRQFLDWLEGKLRDHGVEKVIPDVALLGTAYRRAQRIAGSTLVARGWEWSKRGCARQ